MVDILFNILLPIIFGITCILFHSTLGEKTANFNGSLMNKEYSKTERKWTKRGFLFGGIMFLLVGVFSLLQFIEVI